MKKYAYILFMAVCVALYGCNANGCLENRNSVPLAGFYSSADSTKMSLDSLQITGNGMPESDPLSSAGKIINQVYLPMRSTQQSTSWVFAYKWKYLDHPALNDTITFDYDSTPFFSSSECGVIFKYHITNVSFTRHLIEGVELVDSVITNVDKEQIRIFFRVGNDADSDNDNDADTDDDTDDDYDADTDNDADTDLEPEEGDEQ